MPVIWHPTTGPRVNERDLDAGPLIRAHLLLLIGTVCRKHERELLKLAAGKAQRRSRRDALMRQLAEASAQ